MPFSKLQLFKSNICTATRVKVMGKRVCPAHAIRAPGF